LLAVHGVPGRDGLVGPLGVVVDRGLRVVGRLRAEQLGAEEAGLHQHRADPERRDLGSQRLDPALDPELGGGIGGAELLANDAGGRGDRDEEAGALGAQDRQDRAGDVHGAEQGGLDLGPDVLGADLLEEPGVEVAGVVDQHVDAAEPFDGGARGVLGVGGVGDVELDGQEVVVRSERRADPLGVASGGDDGVADGQGGRGDVDAHPAPRTGDEPHLLVSHLSALPSG
jgi:hypothetical protein